jgi:AGZA family xanthine/uracil permease-like MFS transporter
VAKSKVGRRFRLEFSGHKFERRGSRFLTEIRAGLATFFAMAYIVSVNASIVASCGGTCVCTSSIDPTCLTSPTPEYIQCQQEVRQDLITATAAISCLMSAAMGLFANLPISLAPGMGINVYFTFQVVGVNGTGPVPFRMALTIIFAEGLIFVAMTMLGLRQWLAKLIPASLKSVSSLLTCFHLVK